MDPNAPITDGTEALGSLLDGLSDIHWADEEARDILDAERSHLFETLGPDAAELDVVERAIKRLRTLSLTRTRAEGLVRAGEASRGVWLKFLRAALQQGAYLESLPEDLHLELPTDTLDRYAAAFHGPAGRPFDRKADAITWDEIDSPE
jgi:hypothetical protein